MKKIETIIKNIIESCKECDSCQWFNPQRQGIGSAFICGRTQRLITVAPPPYQFEFPHWCPLETYKETASTSSTTPQTVILPGMPDLEWMTENLSGFGGTEVDGRWYYTYEEAEEAVKQLGNGWRIPKPEEWQAVDKLGSEWQEDGPHGLPGRLFGGELFLEAAGYRHESSGALAYVGTWGLYHDSSTYAAGSINTAFLRVHADNVYPLYRASRASALSVRCVRNIQ